MAPSLTFAPCSCCCWPSPARDQLIAIRHRVQTRTLNLIPILTLAPTLCAAFFMEATYEVVIDPRDIQKCCPPDQPPMYPPITSGEYLVQKYRETHASFEGPHTLVDKAANGAAQS